MIQTGDWTTYDLVKYLVSIKSSLTSQEFENLGQTSIFSREGVRREQLATELGQEVQRYKVMDLYEPVELFRELGLPVIDWGADNQWEPKSDDGKFL
jgi:Protein of unknown function (DUF3684)